MNPPAIDGCEKTLPVVFIIFIGIRIQAANVHEVPNGLVHLSLDESEFRKPSLDIAVAEPLVGDILITKEDGVDVFGTIRAVSGGGDPRGYGGDSCGVSDGRRVAGSDSERGSSHSWDISVPRRPLIDGRAEPLTTGTCVVYGSQHSLEVAPIASDSSRRPSKIIQSVMRGEVFTRNVVDGAETASAALPVGGKQRGELRGEAAASLLTGGDAAQPGLQLPTPELEALQLRPRRAQHPLRLVKHRGVVAVQVAFASKFWND
jgi:hypothetical protein